MKPFSRYTDNGPGKIVSVRFWILDRIGFSIRISFLGEPVAGAVEPLGRDSIAVVFPLSPVLLGGVVAAIVFIALIIALAGRRCRRLS